MQWSVQRGTYLLLLSLVFLWNDNSEIFNLLLKNTNKLFNGCKGWSCKVLIPYLSKYKCRPEALEIIRAMVWKFNFLFLYIYKKKLCHQSIDFLLLAPVMPSHEWREMHDLNFHSSIFLPHTLWWTFNYASWFVSMCAPLWECASNNFTLQCEWTVFSLFPQISYTRRGAMLEVQLTFREKLREQISTWCKSPSICSSGG